MKRISAIIMAIGICTLFSGCSIGNSQLESSTVSSVATTAATVLTEPEEHGTSAYVDYLYYKAKADAAEAADKEINAAANWLKENIDVIFDSQENMELTMYYGELLEHKYKDSGNNYEKIGWQAYKTVKYVYRGAETTSDQSTIDNYAELKNLLLSAGDIS